MMKRNILSLLLLPLLLVGCFSSEKEKTPTEEPQKQEDPPRPELYPLVYEGPQTIIINYGAQYQINPPHLQGSDKDAELIYTYNKVTYAGAGSVTQTGLVTAMEYNRSLSENINECFTVSIRSNHATSESTVILRFVVCHLHEDASFEEISDGGNFHFFISTGIVENLVCHYNDAEKTQPWYAECTLVEEGTGKYFDTTIGKSYNNIGLEDKNVTSHFKYIINRDGKGSETAKNIQNGTKVKFLTMLRYNDEYGFTNRYNTIVMDELALPNEVCSITSLNPKLSVSKTSGRYDEEFTVTRSENIFVHVYGEHGEIYAENDYTDQDTEIVYKIKSKTIKVYSDENIPTEKNLYGTYPNGTNTGPVEFENTGVLHDYMFENQPLIKVKRLQNVLWTTGGLNIGRNGSTTNPYFVFEIDPSLNVTSFTVTMTSLNNARTSKPCICLNNSIINRTLSPGASGTTYTYSGAVKPVTEITFYCNVREVIDHNYTVGFSISDLKLYTNSGLIETL